MAQSVRFCPLPTPKSTSGFSFGNRCVIKSLKLDASFLDFPLASKIMVRNLSYSTSESSLLKEFSNFGQIAEVKLIKDEYMKRSKGYAFIQYNRQEDALLALESMDQKYFDGRVIFVELAKPGKNELGGYPKSSGPPKQPNLPTEDESEC